MFHPLVGDLTSLTDEELTEKLNKLTNMVFQTHNYSLKSQIVSILESYKVEVARRQAALWEKMAEMRNKQVDKLINVD